MKNNVKWIAAAVLLAAFIAGASVLYNKLSPDFSGDRLAQTTENQGVTNGNNSVSQTQSDNLAPDFTVYDEDGNEVKLSDYRGKPVVVNFWATWCQYCKKEMADFNTAYEKYPDVQFLMINATDGVYETKETAQEYVENEGFRFQVFYDYESDALDAFLVSGFPSTFFINANGDMVTFAKGMIEYENLEKGIEYITESISD